MSTSFLAASSQPGHTDASQEGESFNIWNFFREMRIKITGAQTQVLLLRTIVPEVSSEDALILDFMFPDAACARDKCTLGELMSRLTYETRGYESLELMRSVCRLCAQLESLPSFKERTNASDKLLLGLCAEVKRFRKNVLIPTSENDARMIVLLRTQLMICYIRSFVRTGGGHKACNRINEEFELMKEFVQENLAETLDLVGFITMAVRTAVGKPGVDWTKMQEWIDYALKEDCAFQQELKDQVKFRRLLGTPMIPPT